MPSGSVLITGVSGHVGFAVLAEALSAGHHVHAVVRKESQIDRIRTAASARPYSGQLDFIVIPDLTAPDAFDTVAEDVWAVIHVASPTFSGLGGVNVADFTTTAWRITRGVLEYAAKRASVERVVITSSINAILPNAHAQMDTDCFFTNESPISIGLLDDQPPEAPENEAYTISKIHVANEINKYMESQKPSFSVVNIIPATTIGRNGLASTLAELLTGSNMSALVPLLGFQNWPVPSIVSHVDDVAFAHVKGLSVDVPPGATANIMPVWNQKTSPAPWSYDDSIQIVKEEFPEVVERGVFPFGGSVPSLLAYADSTADEKLLGTKFKGYREAVVDLVRQYLELSSK